MPVTPGIAVAAGATHLLSTEHKGVLMFRKSAIALAMALGLAAGHNAAFAGDGTVLAVVQMSEADGQTGKRVLVMDGPVFSGDRIVTGPSGNAQIKFRDNTRLVVGPNSTMVIDAFIFGGDGEAARKVTINAVRGAFRFITGNSPKDAYSITTPTATIGVRG
jgi:hypothetical protein